MDPDPVPADPAEPTADDVIAEAVAIEHNNRAWLGSIVRVLDAYSHEPARNELVQCALDTLVVAACERGKRILRSDLK